MSIAEEIGEKIREVSIAEFFEKNRHLLGYENPTRSLLTVVKEAVDNSIDACLEARILPTIKVLVKEIGKNRYKVRVEDNGPGLIPEKIPIAFAKFLVGSKFYTLRQSVGIHGIGIKGVVLYSQLTTSKPTKITTFFKGKQHEFKLLIDVTKNEPQILSHEIKDVKENLHGLIIETEVEGRYVEGLQSIPVYLRYISLANPYTKIIFDGPNGKQVFERVVEELPPLPKEIKPHPYGVELGRFERMLKLTSSKNLISFLTKEFCRMGKGNAKKICKLARIPQSKKPSETSHEEAEKLYEAMQMVKFMSPPTDCLSNLKEEMLIAGLKREFPAEFYAAAIRKPSVYRGNPFQVQVGLAYGEKIQTQQAILLRFANHTPLLYNQAECAITRAAEEINWRSYGLSQSEGCLPQAPLVIFVDFLSVWIPYTSEGKQAIANYPEITKEIKLALQEVGRNLASYLRKKEKIRESELRKSLFEIYIPELAEALSKLTKQEKEKIELSLRELIKKGDKFGKS